MALVGRPRVSVQIRQPGRAGLGGRHISQKNCIKAGFKFNHVGESRTE